MRRVCLACVGVGAIALLGVASAAGHRPAAIPTQVLIGFHGGTNGPNQFVMSASGPLNSPVAKCSAGRTVKLFFKTAGGARKLVDVDISSQSGEWGVAGRSSFEPQAFIVAVTRAQVKVHHHLRTCGADRVVTPLSLIHTANWAPGASR